jgi:hypothetical protein
MENCFPIVKEHCNPSAEQTFLLILLWSLITPILGSVILSFIAVIGFIISLIFGASYRTEQPSDDRI